MEKVFDYIFPILILLYLLPKKFRRCPACKKWIIPKRLQPYIFGWNNYDWDWKCPSCEAEWQEGSFGGAINIVKKEDRMK